MSEISFWTWMKMTMLSNLAWAAVGILLIVALPILAGVLSWVGAVVNNYILGRPSSE